MWDEKMSKADLDVARATFALLWDQAYARTTYSAKIRDNDYCYCLARMWKGDATEGFPRWMREAVLAAREGRS